jgi:hypothetical protein
LGAGNGYHPLRMVSQVVEAMLHELTIKDVEEKATSHLAQKSITVTVTDEAK